MKTKPKKVDRESIVVDNKTLNELKKMLDIKLKRCHYCMKKIDFKNDKFGIFNKPTRLICGSLLCLYEAVDDDGKDKKRV